MYLLFIGTIELKYSKIYISWKNLILLLSKCLEKSPDFLHFVWKNSLVLNVKVSKSLEVWLLKTSINPDISFSSDLSRNWEKLNFEPIWNSVCTLKYLAFGKAVKLFFDIKKTLWPIYMDGVQLSQAYRTITRRQLPFYH